MTLDIGDTIAPKSDQLDAVDLLTGPRVFTIERVTKNNAEQPFNIHLAEFPRPWRPGLSMRRVLVDCWGPDAATYAGRRVKLWCDRTVRFGNEEVGGTRILALSHIDRRLSIPLLVSRGRTEMYRVEPLPDDAPNSTTVSEATLDELVALFARKGIPDDKRLAGVNHYAGGSATSLEAITEDQARRMIGVLKQRPDPEPSAADPGPPTDADFGVTDPAGEQYVSGQQQYDPAAEPEGWQQ
jgi:hypothetical protein